MIHKFFKYHMCVYDIYQEFGERPFAAKEVYEIEIPGLSVAMLEAKGYIETISRQEAEYLRSEIENWSNAPWIFRKVTEEGIILAEYLEEHPDIFAKKLLLEK